MNENEKNTGTICINGEIFVGEGVSDFDMDCSRSVMEAYMYEYGRYVEGKDGHITFEMSVTRVNLLRITGCWDWVLENCDDRRVVHLMKFGRNDRIKLKNFNRAMRIIARKAGFVRVS